MNILMKELHHRVKILQIISLMSLQSSELKTLKPSQAIRDSQQE